MTYGVTVTFRPALILAIVACASLARAQATREPPPEAVQLSNQAAEHYANGQYGEAAADLEDALQLDPGSPTLLYNLARVYELMGDVDKALANAEAYLLVVPPENEEERMVAESTVQRLTGARDYLALREQAESQGGAPELRQLTPRVIVRDRGVADNAVWITMAIAGATLVAGGVLGGIALAREDDGNEHVLLPCNRVEEPEQCQLQEDTLRARIADDGDKADRLALTTDILLATGAAIGLTSLLLYLLRVKTYEGDAPSASLQLGPGFAGLSIGGRL